MYCTAGPLVQFIPEPWYAQSTVWDNWIGPILIFLPHVSFEYDRGSPICETDSGSCEGSLAAGPLQQGSAVLRQKLELAAAHSLYVPPHTSRPNCSSPVGLSSTHPEPHSRRAPFSRAWLTVKTACFQNKSAKANFNGNIPLSGPNIYLSELYDLPPSNRNMTPLLSEQCVFSLSSSRWRMG